MSGKPLIELVAPGSPEATLKRLEQGDSSAPKVLETEGRHNPSVGRLPIIVGISGKRSFDPDPQQSERIAISVKERLGSIFRKLDEEFPCVPKVLLTGGAFGTDTVAAEAALQTESNMWSVALILPFDVPLFEKDFRAESDPDPQVNAKRCAIADNRLASLRALISAATSGPDQRVMLTVLPPLSVCPGRMALPEDLDKDNPNADPVLRHNHYEQVGQVIAESATLLIAVMDADEKPRLSEADGGTARVVACRRAGQPDEYGADVARRSSVLRNEWDELRSAPGGFVWIVDPQSRPPSHGYPVTVLPPLNERSVADVYRGRPGSDWPREPTAKDPLTWFTQAIHHAEHALRDSLAKFAPRIALRATPPPHRELQASLGVAKAFKDFQIMRTRAAERISPRPPDLPLQAFLAALDQPLSHLSALRAAIRPVQASAKQRSDKAFGQAAFGFVAAVLALEVASKVSRTTPIPLMLYLLALIGVTWVVLFAQHCRWQQRAEDYRAVSEMLRVQRAWWASGLADRVDWLHLQGVDADLGRVRDAARTILGWVWLRSRWPTAVPPDADTDWSLVRAAGNPYSAIPRETREITRFKKPPSDWVGEQIWYYGNNHERRERRVSRRNVTTWFLFTTSGFLAAFLLVSSLIPVVGTWFRAFAYRPATIDLPVFAPLLWVGVAILSMCLRLQLHAVRGRSLAKALTVLFGITFAYSLGAIAQLLGQPVALFLNELKFSAMHAEQYDAVSVAKELTGTFFVLLTAIAGAIRFLTEKLALEPEALAYRDGLDRFERAELVLAELTDPGTGQPTDLTRYRRVVRELGILALSENEHWLKAHRERPLHPVV